MTDLSSVQKKYKGMWVAFEGDMRKVIVASKNAKTAYEKALDMGYKKPTLFKMPLENIPYVSTA